MIVARALEALEEQLDKSLHETLRLLAGTSTGAIIAAAIAAGLTGKEMLSVYEKLGPEIFRKSWRSRLWPLSAIGDSTLSRDRELSHVAPPVLRTSARSISAMFSQLPCLAVQRNSSLWTERWASVASKASYRAASVCVFRLYNTTRILSASGKWTSTSSFIHRAE
ncbi:MAG: patatin-like phospholipase family protein [Candidatus Zixiibacteriota bacterium]|nr:MAG: patatin-like phospholipase family protein [candidate division Zixibacteria bacterium]